MRAIILAAGIGSRLEGMGGGQPKALLEVGGETLLERHARNLTHLGVHEVVVVTGHLGERLEAEMRSIASRLPVRWTARPNPRFTEGSVLSIAAASADLTDDAAPLLLMDADVLYARDMLERLVRAPEPTALLIDRGCAVDEDDPVLVPVRAGRPFDLCKRFRGEYELIGESVGFFKLGARDVSAWRDAVEDVVRETAGAGTFEDVVQRLVQAGRFGHVDVTGSPWIEIDFPQDLERARTQVLDAIRALGG